MCYLTKNHNGDYFHKTNICSNRSKQASHFSSTGYRFINTYNLTLKALIFQAKPDTSYHILNKGNALSVKKIITINTGRDIWLHKPKNCTSTNINNRTAIIQSNAAFLHIVRHMSYHTLSMPPRLVTSTKRRCKSSGLPPMVGILQSREKFNLISDILKIQFSSSRSTQAKVSLKHINRWKNPH